MKHSIFTVVLTMILVVSALLAFSNIASAQMPTKMIGYAWAPNWGWLNFGTNDAPRVSVNPTTGIFTGYGWSSNIGWIRMGSDLTGPTGATDPHGVQAASSGSDYAITGWMRACSAFQNQSLCSGLEKPITGTERGGWDGWFKMKNVVYDPDTSAYTGYSWGDLVGGWVNFAAYGVGDTNCPVIINGACNPACTTCGDGPGGSFSANCKVDPASGTVGATTGTLFTWQAYNESNGVPPYTYTWREKTVNNFSALDPFLPTIPSSSLRSVALRYSTASNYYRQVKVTDNNGQVTTADCKSDVNRDGNYGDDGIIVTGGNCTLMVNMTGTTTAIVNYNGISGACTSDATLKTKNCTYAFSSCPSTGNAIAVSTVNSWTGACVGTNTKVCTLPDILSGQSKTVTADFGGTGEIVIKNRVDGSNLVNIDRPASYPTHSTPIADISSTNGDVKVFSWGSLLATADGCGTYPRPKLCIGGNYGEAGATCIEIGSDTSFTVPAAGKTIRWYFPHKCPNSSKISVFHKPAGTWNISLVPVAGGDSKILRLYFNDPNPYNQ